MHQQHSYNGSPSLTNNLLNTLTYYYVITPFDQFIFITLRNYSLDLPGFYRDPNISGRRISNLKRYQLLGNFPRVRPRAWAVNIRLAEPVLTVWIS